MKQDLQNNEPNTSIENINFEELEVKEIASPDSEKDISNTSIEDATSSEAVADDIKDEEVVVRHRRKRRHHHRKKKIALKIIVAILAVIAVLGIAAFAFFQHGAYSVKAAPNLSDLPQQKTIDYKGHKYVMNDDMITVLIIGHDDEADTSRGAKASEADAIMAMAIDMSTGKASIIGIPRDTMCFVDQYADGSFAGSIKEQICLAYGYGRTAEEGSQNVVKSASSVLCNIPIQYYYTLDEEAIADLNDAIGGVTLVPLQTIPKTNIVEGEETTLLGKAAHDYVQWRDTSVLSSAADRQERGVQYIKAFTKQLFDTSNGGMKTLSDLLSIISAYSTTNISPSELTYLTNTIASGNNKDIDITMLEGTTTQNGNYAELELNEGNVYETVLDTYYVKVD